MKKLLKKILALAGYHLQKNQPAIPPGHPSRPVGNFTQLLQDLKERGLDCKQVLDVGANAGHWSGMANLIFPNAKYLLIEPQEEMKAKLEQLCAIQTNMHFVLAGAGPKATEMVLTVWDDLLGTSLLPAPDAALKANNKQRTIPIVTIDGLLDSGKMKVPELVKLDIQGFELEALRGAEKLFGQTEVFILEVSMFAFDGHQNQPEFFEVVQFMFERGYVVYDFPGFGRRPYDGALGQCDICFVKQNGFLRSSDRWS